MIWGDGGAADVVVGVLWCLCGVVIGAYYVFRIGWRVLNTAADSVKRRIWGAFIFSCGLGHFAMVAYMALWHEPWVFRWVVVPVDVFTLLATIEAGHRSPDVPT